MFPNDILCIFIRRLFRQAAVVLKELKKNRVPLVEVIVIAEPVGL